MNSNLKSLENKFNLYFIRTKIDQLLRIRF